MKKSKKVLLSAAIAAAIMGSVSLPQIQAAEIGSGVEVSASPISELHNGKYDVKTTNKHLNTTLATQKGLENVNSELAGKANAADIAQKVQTNQVIADEVNAISVNASNLNVGGQASFNDNVSIDKNLNVGGDVKANHVDAANINASGTLSGSNINGTTVNANTVDTNNTKTGSLQVTGTASFDNGLDVTGNVNASTITAVEANVVNSNISHLTVSGKAEFNGKDGVSISDSLTVGNDTFNVDAESGITSAKNLHGDQLTAGNATFDTTDANTTKTGTLTVTGDTRLEGTTLAKEIGAGKVVSDEIEAGKTTTDSLTVTGNTRLAIW